MLRQLEYIFERNIQYATEEVQAAAAAALPLNVKICEYEMFLRRKKGGGRRFVAVRNCE